MLHGCGIFLFRVTLFRINQITTLVGFSLDRFHLINGAHLLQLGRLMLDRCVMDVGGSTLRNTAATKELCFFLTEEKLLGPEHTARSGDSDPTNELLSWDLVSFHGKETDQGSCAAKASFTMNGDRTWVWGREVSVADVQEIFHYIFRRV